MRIELWAYQWQMYKLCYSCMLSMCYKWQYMYRLCVRLWGCVLCSDTNCIDCSTNYTTCQKCKQTYGVDSGGSCTLCSDSNCLDCSNNFNTCNYCKLTYYNAGTCQPCGNHCARCISPSLCISCNNGYGIMPSTTICGACTSLYCLACPTVNTICEVCDTNYTLNIGIYIYLF